MKAAIPKNKNRLIVVAGFLIITSFLAGHMHMVLAQRVLAIVSTLIASVPIFFKAYRSLRVKIISIELLVCMAVIGAISIHEYTESSIVTFLFLLGEYLEARTLKKTRESLKELMDMAPREAVVIRNSNHVTISVEEVVVGDRLVIRSGGKIPVDGKIVTGHAFINEATITGESVSVVKTAGIPVFSGTIVENGYIEMIAEKVGEDTAFAKIIELVEEAQESKTKSERFLNRFSKMYTPSIMFLSILVFGITRNIEMAITFLVIACPGALVIGAPVSSVAGMGNGANNGVLVKGVDGMEKFSKADTVIFDKTGTLTQGKPVVTDIKTFQSIDSHELLRLVAQAEMISEHPLGETIVREARTRNLNLKNEYEFAEVIKGYGVRAKAKGGHLVIGNQRLMKKENIHFSKDIAAYAVAREKEGNTAIFAALNGKIAGIISITDQIREDAQRVIDDIKKNGIKRVVILTGDNQHTAELVSNKLKIDEYYAELLPEDKVNFVKKLKEKGSIVAMVGDGINDAPAIATADIGIAMGMGGTDISKETAEIVLMGDSFTQLAHAYALSKATVRNIKQNTFFAVCIAFVLLIGVLTGFVHLASGMFVHQGSVLLVILNATRLIRFQATTKFHNIHAR
ncbi:heavy metal translocating P-type ATPase [Neobacillus sp. LXY-1]|uniref:heavy metal translocating P-type ATPase n=1 Tax=Neobacillus sp. LXY-1 TaxID=3379133 RepID=UPI003EDFCD73